MTVDCRVALQLRFYPLAGFAQGSCVHVYSPKIVNYSLCAKNPLT